jgi:hypothetical protein
VSDDIEAMKRALRQIAKIAINAGVEDDFDLGHSEDSPNLSAGCTLLQLPDHKREIGLQRAIQLNPANRVSGRQGARTRAGSGPSRLAIDVTRYWGKQQQTLTVSFMESIGSDLRNRIMSHMNAWSSRCGIRFAHTNNVGVVRITRGGGDGVYQSYLGTDVLTISRNAPTLWLGGFTMSHDESEFRRVVRHEAGHTLGFVHEHMRKELVARIDRARAIAYFGRPPNNWSPAMVDAQVLTPLDDNTLFRTPPDQDSIMCYQLPGSITIDGKPIRGGADINETDYRFAALVYPKAGSTPADGGATPMDVGRVDEPAEEDDDDMWEDFQHGEE